MIATKVIYYHYQFYHISSLLFSGYRHVINNVMTTCSVVPMIDYKRKSFIYMQPIIDLCEFWGTIIIGKSLNKRISLLFNTICNFVVQF